MDKTPLLPPREHLDDIVHGFVEPGYEPVAWMFRSNFTEGLDTGAAFCAFHKGRPIVDIWGGLKHTTTRDVWEKDTMTMAMSSTKAVVAVSLAHLADRGKVDYNRQVAHYWPEFAQNGKQHITVEQLVSHQAGLIGVNGDVVDMKFVQIPSRISKTLAKQRPAWTPGSCHGYHMATMGWYVDQIVCRVDQRGRNLATYFREEISEPFDIDFYIGLPKSHDHRVAKIESREWQGLRHLFFHHNRQFWSLTLLALRCNSFYNKAKAVGSKVHTLKVFNSRWGQENIMPHVNGIGSARSLAKLFGIIANGGYDVSSGGRLLSFEMCERLVEPVVRGLDQVYRVPDLFSMFSLGLEVRNEKNRFIAGHPGYGGQAVYMDPTNKLAWCYLTNRLCLYGSPDQDPRYHRVKDKLMKCQQYNAVECSSL